MIAYWRTKQKKVSPFLCCSILSEIFIFHGKDGATQERFDQLWTYDSYPPSISTALHRVKFKNIKWYINKFMDVEDPIWNGSFIHGLSTCGHIKWNRFDFPSMHWTTNESIFNVLRDCPFYGVTNEGVKEHFKWCNVPAFYLKYDPKSISFMAGVLATGQLIERNGEIYADYGKLAYPHLKEFNIPIEYESEGNYHNLISPFWAALFSIFMPEDRKKWVTIKNAHKANLYAAILSRMYVSNRVERAAIPYLKSRRWVYDNYGKVEDTEGLWLEMGLSQLDKRVRRVMRSWIDSV